MSPREARPRITSSVGLEHPAAGREGAHRISPNGRSRPVSALAGPVNEAPAAGGGAVCLGVPVFFASTTVPSGAISIAAVPHRTPLHELRHRAGEIREILRRELGRVLA